MGIGGSAHKTENSFMNTAMQFMSVKYDMEKLKREKERHIPYFKRRN